MEGQPVEEAACRRGRRTTPVAHGEVFVARSNVKSPLLVLTATECVLPSSRSTRLAFRLVPADLAVHRAPPDALSLFFAAAPYKQHDERGRSRSRRLIATASKRTTDERLCDLDLVRRSRAAASPRRARPASRAPTGSARTPARTILRSSPVRRRGDADDRERPALPLHRLQVRARFSGCGTSSSRISSPGSSVVSARSSSVGRR